MTTCITVHRRYTIRIHSHRFTAVCTCGWESPKVHTAGLAGAVWDRHKEGEERQ